MITPILVPSIINAFLHHFLFPFVLIPWFRLPFLLWDRSHTSSLKLCVWTMSSLVGVLQPCDTPVQSKLF
ncbi:hypothetical protein M758_UG238200 [Ceratodon purpureus]|nr:hypothetical protein M758_UG238200 [Ceratodon purpureus]